MADPGEFSTSFAQFESIVRRAHESTDASPSQSSVHPFEMRNVHPDFPSDVRALFDNGHYVQAAFESFKFVDEEVQRISGETDYGTALMHKVFGGQSPKLRLNPGATQSEQSEQEGYQFLFAGGMLGIRNPRGHVSGMRDDLDLCLDHLALASMLLRKLEAAALR